MLGNLLMIWFLIEVSAVEIKIIGLENLIFLTLPFGVFFVIFISSSSIKSLLSS
jgi:hypothetical protein